MESTVPMTNLGELCQLVLIAAKQNGNSDIYNRPCKKNQSVNVANTTVTFDNPSTTNLVSC